MKRQHAMAICLIGSYLQAGVVSAEQPLRWKFQAGEQLRYARSEEMVTETAVAGRTVKDTMTRSREMLLQVTSVRTDGTAQVTQTIVRVKHVAESARGNIDFDSARDDALNQVPPERKTAVALLVGAKFTYSVTAQGIVTDIVVAPETLETLRKSAPQVAESLKGEFKHLIPVLALPEKSIAQGHEWEERTEFTEPVVGTRKITTTYRSLGSAAEAGRPIEKIQTATSLTLHPAENSPIQVELQEYEGTGIIHFDSAAGRMTWRQDKDLTRMKLSNMGRFVDQTARRTITLQLGAPDR